MVPLFAMAIENGVALSTCRRSCAQVWPRSLEQRMCVLYVTVPFALSAQATHTLLLFVRCTARDREEPMRSPPIVGAFDHGMVTPATTLRPGRLSLGSLR